MSDNQTQSQDQQVLNELKKITSYLHSMNVTLQAIQKALQDRR